MIRQLHKIYTTGPADCKPGSGRRRTARTDDNVNRVEDHLKERLIEDWRRFDQNIIHRPVFILKRVHILCVKNFMIKYTNYLDKLTGIVLFADSVITKKILFHRGK